MTTSSDYEVRDEDRLPWLETVDEDYDQGPSVLRVVLMVVLGLAIIAAAIFGYYWYQQHQGADGNGALIVAQEGDYKVKPDDPGGLKVEGEGRSGGRDQRRRGWGQCVDRSQRDAGNARCGDEGGARRAGHRRIEQGSRGDPGLGRQADGGHALRRARGRAGIARVAGTARLLPRRRFSQ